MVRDIAVAALVGPGLVLGLAITFDIVGLLSFEGLAQRVVTVLAVVVGLGTFVLVHGSRSGIDAGVDPGGERARDNVG